MNDIYENIKLFLKIKVNNKWNILSNYLIENPNSKLVNFDDIIIELTIEVGKKFHKIHLHSLISIFHNIIVQFDRFVLQSYLKKMLELKEIY
jgi:hypothetical protein